MGSLKRKLSKRIQSNIHTLMNINWDYIALSSQTDFNLAFSPEDLPWVYDYAQSLLNSDKKELALSLLQRVGNYPYPHPCQADAFAHISLSILNQAQEAHQSRRQSLLAEAYQYLSKASTLRQSNSLTLGGWALYYYISKDYQHAADTVLTLEEGAWKNFILLQTFCRAGGVHSLLNTINSDIDTLVAAFAAVYNWSKQTQSVYQIKLGLVLGELYTLAGAFLSAYQLYDSLLTVSSEPLLYSRLGEICYHLDRIDEAESYYRQALAACEELFASTDTADDLNREALQNIIHSSRTNLAAIACEQGRNVEESIAVLEKELADGSSSNPVYHNLAMCYFWKQDYQKSLDYCRHALALGQDETTLHLIAKNLHGDGQFEQALLWYQKALIFIDSMEPALCFTCENSPDSFSFSRPEWLENKKKGILTNIIQCCLESGQMTSAQSWYSLASAQWPRDDNIANLKPLLAKLSSGTQRSEQAPDESRLYPVIKQEMQDLFPACNSLTIEFLATGEFLYRLHTQSDMDYSPVLIEYCKALEHELALYLRRTGQLSPAVKPTLGSLSRLIQKLYPDEHTATVLDTILSYRNMAAHNAVITKKMADTLRASLIQQGWFSVLTGQIQK